MRPDSMADYPAAATTTVFDRQKKDVSSADKSGPHMWSGRSRTSPFQEVSAQERAQLEQWARQRTSPYRLVVRSRIVLLASRGLTVAAIAAKVQVTPATVRLWTRRFSHGGAAALMSDAPRRGRRPGSRIPVAAVLEATRQLAGESRTVRQVAKLAGTSPSSVCRVWRRFDLGSDCSIASIEAAIRKLLSETVVGSR
jgi:transposase-like protein